MWSKLDLSKFIFLSKNFSWNELLVWTSPIWTLATTSLILREGSHNQRVNLLENTNNGFKVHLKDGTNQDVLKSSLDVKETTFVEEILAEISKYFSSWWYSKSCPSCVSRLSFPGYRIGTEWNQQSWKTCHRANCWLQSSPIGFHNKWSLSRRKFS